MYVTSYVAIHIIKYATAVYLIVEIDMKNDNQIFHSLKHALALWTKAD